MHLPGRLLVPSISAAQFTRSSELAVRTLIGEKTSDDTAALDILCQFAPPPTTQQMAAREGALRKLASQLMDRLRHRPRRSPPATIQPTGAVTGSTDEGANPAPLQPPQTLGRPAATDEPATPQTVSGGETPELHRTQSVASIGEMSQTSMTTSMAQSLLRDSECSSEYTDASLHEYNEEDDEDRVSAACSSGDPTVESKHQSTPEEEEDFPNWE